MYIAINELKLDFWFDVGMLFYRVLLCVWGLVNINILRQFVALQQVV